MASSSPATSSSWGGGETLPPAPAWPAPRRPPRRHGPPLTRSSRRRHTLQTVGGAGRANVHPALAQRHPTRRPVTPCRRPAPRRAAVRPGWVRDFGTHGAHEAAPALRGRRSGGRVAAADMSSTEPAWIPPMRGSTNIRRRAGRACGTPAGRLLGRRSAPAHRAVAAGHHGRGRARRGRPRCQSGAVGQNRVGIPSAWPSGNVRRRPRAQTDAPALRWARARRPTRPRGTGRPPRAGGRGIRRAPCRPRGHRSLRSAAGHRGGARPPAR